MDLVYKYSYGTEDVLGASIQIYKEVNNYYNLVAEFITCNLETQPKITTIYKVISRDEVEEVDELQHMIIKKYDIKILANCNPPPEKLFLIKNI